MALDKGKVIRAKIERAKAHRKIELAVVRRHRRRRTAALARGERKVAARELKIIRRHRKAAQEYRQDVIHLRREYREYGRLVRLLRHRRRVLGKQGLTWFDGHQVATWIVNDYLIPARKAGIYFRVTSGVRTLATAQYLWNNAGRLGLIHYVSVAYPCSSNHCGYVYPKGAVDLSPPWRVGPWIRSHQTSRPLRWYRDVVGSRDDVHFSHTGH